MKSYVSVSLALRRDCRVSDSISAIVVDGVFGSDPFETPILIRVKVLELFLVPPSLALGSTKLGFHRGLTTIDMEALVGSDKWGLRPVSLLEPTSCGPIICVPKARVDLHGLVEWEFHSQIFAVFEHSYWDVIHKESGK